MILELDTTQRLNCLPVKFPAFRSTSFKVQKNYILKFPRATIAGVECFAIPFKPETFHVSKAARYDPVNGRGCYQYGEYKANDFEMLPDLPELLGMPLLNKQFKKQVPRVVVVHRERHLVLAGHGSLTNPYRTKCHHCGYQFFFKLQDRKLPDISQKTAVLWWLYSAGVRVEGSRLVIANPQPDIADIVTDAIRRVELTNATTEIMDHAPSCFRSYDGDSRGGWRTPSRVSRVCPMCHKPKLVTAGSTPLEAHPRIDVLSADCFKHVNPDDEYVLRYVRMLRLFRRFAEIAAFNFVRLVTHAGSTV